ncbi:hypothetical protein HPULCUR_004986 [Helicostylum pulchrum]|uniref:Polyprenol reductase n=1 Tax=Helicostylum pulchrum TaxID=562976 RepID=A0ABP9XYU5_9FUNG
MEPDEYYESIELHIRWSDRQDLVFNVPVEETIYAIKQKIRQSSKDAKTLKDYNIGKINITSSKAKLEQAAPVYFHCSLSDYTPETPSLKNNQPQMTPPTGFDRLRESGFTEEDIRNIRTQFHRLHGTPFEEGPTEEARNLEEQWMDNTGETLPDGRTYKEMMWGLMLGFFLGIICLFWFRESVFSRRHQMGIVAAILSMCAKNLHELQASVLSYGKLNLHNQKKPTTFWATQLSNLIVPKHYFSHFYIVGLLFALICIVELSWLQYYKQPLLLISLLQHYDSLNGTHALDLQSCIIGLTLMTFHLVRRVYESFWIERPSKTSTMHISHYLAGIGFYGAMVFGTWLEGLSSFGKPIIESFRLTTILAIALFFYASYHQYQCHVILASLRKESDGYTIPRGDWFERIVTPHYFADILIYLSLCILYRFQSIILNCGLVWTITNLSIIANETSIWYRIHFSAEKYNKAFPKGRWRIMPGY